jgi:hypothetical protein
MAVCKKCGCAIPLGRKSCDMCAAVGAVAPAYQPQMSPPPPPASAPLYSPPVAGSVARPPRGTFTQPPGGAYTQAPGGGSTPPPPGWAYATAPPAVPANIQKAEKEVKSAWHYLVFLGVLYIVLGALTGMGYMDDLNGLFGWIAVVIGMVFLSLAFFVRQGSVVALGIAIGVYALYTVAFFLSGAFAFFRVIVLLYMLRSLGAMNTVRQHRKLLAQQPAPDQSRAA